MLARWKPLEGVQTEALESKADILLYGGAAGGGKTDMLLGCARQHHRAIIFRRVFPNLRGVIDRAKEIYPQFGGVYNESTHRWAFPTRHQVHFGMMQHEENKKQYQGRPYSLYGFDEITEFTESQFRFVTGWNRSTVKGERCRIICTTNPPTTADGEWIIKFWGPWLDTQHPNPAKPGELRWFTTNKKGEDVELMTGDPVVIDGEERRPRSRTFIPAKIQDNPFLANTDYIATLQALPEPLRSKLLKGDFTAGREDVPNQLIPTQWVLEAQARWLLTKEPTTPMTVIGVDIARGGKDRTVLTPRFDNYVGRQKIEPGKSTPDGDAVVKLVDAMAMGHDPKLNVDVIGVGSSVYDQLKKTRGLNKVWGIQSAGASKARDKSTKYGFVNLRAEMWWKLREALDPKSGQELMIPDDRELLADLCAITYEVTLKGIKAESKDDLSERIGRSPDKGDSLVYAVSQPHFSGAGYLTYYEQMNAEAATAKDKK